MPDKQLLILDKTQIQQKINRIAYQIWEDNFTESEIVIAGIVGCGYILSERVKSVIEQISDIKVTLIKITLNKHNIHLPITTDVPVEGCSDKVVVLVDDVLHSGRTLAYGLKIFLHVPLKKMRTMVMVDRSHRIFPVSPDFTGMQLATVLKEHVDFKLDANNEIEGVYLS